MMYVDGMDTYILPERGDIFAWSAWDTTTDVPGRFNVGIALTMGYEANASPGLINSTAGWRFFLAAGTYTITIIHRTGATAGIHTVYLDGVSIGTFDQYSAADTYNVVATFTGVVLSAGVHILTMTTASKNVSASAYRRVIQEITATRTGA